MSLSRCIVTPIPILLFAGAFFIFAVSSSVYAASTYYVATNGNDGNPGTLSSPFRTLAKGASVMSGGDTLIARGGIYSEPIPALPSGSSWSSATVIKNYAGETVTIMPAQGAMAIGSGVHHIIVDGINMDGSNESSSWNDMLWIGNSQHHIRFLNLDVRNAAGQGILTSSMNGGTYANEFINIRVYNNGHRVSIPGYGPQHYHGIYFGGPSCADCLIENSEIYNNAGYGVHIYPGSNNVIVRNNRIYGNGCANCTAYGLIMGGSGGSITNNIIYGNNGGIYLGYDAPINIKILNNTIYDNNKNSFNADGIQIASNASGIAVKNNIVYKHNAGNIINYGSMSESNNLVGTDPRFVNAAGGDFHLQSSSPAINAGITLSEVPTDFETTPRPQGCCYDIGADELGGGGPGPSPTPSPSPSPSPSPLPGDLNHDNTVNSLDWSIMNGQWNTPGPEADINGDGIVNSLDFGILNGNWGRMI